MSVSLVDGHIDSDAPRMRDNEIIKALEWHSNDEIHCCACTYEEHSVTHYCVDMVMKDALDLINRQKAEIEKCENIIRLADKTIKTQSAEIERFKEECSCLGCENEWLKAHYERGKAEAVKEFAERLKDKITMSPHSFISIDKWYIDNLVKEMVGE